MKAIFLFELNYFFKRISTWVYFLLMFSFGLLTIASAGGVLGDNIVIHIGSRSILEHVNNPYNIAIVIGFLSMMFGTMFAANIFGHAAYQDFEHGTFSLIFTTPISKNAYLGGRFAASLVIFSILLLCLVMGCWFPSGTGWIDAEKLGSNSLKIYLIPLFVLAFPNMLFLGGLYFSLTALTRSFNITYILRIVIIAGYMIATKLFVDVENLRVAALIDPFGLTSLNEVTRYWTIEDKNTLMVPLHGMMLLNRIIWGGLGILFALGAAWKFKFSHQAGKESKNIKKISIESAKEENVSADFSFTKTSTHSFFQFFSLVRLYTATILKNRYFLIIFGTAVALFLSISSHASRLYGTNTFPVTYAMCEVLRNNFTLFFLIIITFYVGELVWQERDRKH